jgi:predicted RNase H-like nuclease (RuvC/YqgF family)
MNNTPLARIVCGLQAQVKTMERQLRRQDIDINNLRKQLDDFRREQNRGYLGYD